MKLHNEGRVVATGVYSAWGCFVVLILTTVIFPVRGLAYEFPGAASEQQVLPAFKSSHIPYYPDAAKRDGLEGKILVAFDIVAGGRVANLVIIFSDERVFEKTAMEFMSGVRFVVPDTWASSKSRYQRYHMGFLFCIPPSGLVDTFGIAASPVTFSTNRIRGSPIRNPPAAGAVGRCATE